MKRKERIRRYSTSKDMNYHGIDRAATAQAMAHERYDMLPTMESIRKVIWRGPNGWGDNTSFGDCHSSEPTHRYLLKFLNHHIGRSYDEYYSKMCKKFKGKDRVTFDWFLSWKFQKYYYFCGRHIPDYGIENGLIVKYR